jgi:hypothetical protein
MRRREFIAILGGAAAWPVSARAQQAARMRRIGVLLFAAEDRAAINPFVSGLEALGYIDGKTVAIAYGALSVLSSAVRCHARRLTTGLLAVHCAIAACLKGRVPAIHNSVRIPHLTVNQP